MNYNNKKFKAISNSENGEISDEVIFHYKQEGNVLTCSYSGGQILAGQLIGLVDENGNINMRYHQVNKRNELMTGICKSTPEVMKNGKIRLLENDDLPDGIPIRIPEEFDPSPTKEILLEKGLEHDIKQPESITLNYDIYALLEIK